MPTILRNASGDLITRRILQRNPTYLNVSKNILARQSIFKNLDCNIEHNIKKVPSILTEEQIKQSSIYQRLILRLQRARQRQQREKIQHEKKMKWLEQQIKETKQSIKEDKLDIWQVRNEAVDLQEIFDEEMEVYEELCQMIQAQMEENHHNMFMNNGQQYDEDDGQEYLEDENSQQTGQQDDSQNQYIEGDSTNRVSEERDSFSKPTCSIKFMITQRSIETPDLSKIHINSGRQPFSNQTHQNRTHNFMNQQSEEETINSRILSFKKSQNIFTNNQ